jgi:xanthine dehydrogenase accessory factor
VDSNALTVIVRGVGDVGSAIAHRLFRENYAVVIHDDPTPTTTRRGMAFADAVFDGSAILESGHAVRTHDLARVKETLDGHAAISVYVRDIGPLLADVRPDVLVDARLRRPAQPEVQRGLAEFTVGLGPSLVAGRHADVVVETSWERLGAVIAEGPVSLANSAATPGIATSMHLLMASSAPRHASATSFVRVKRLPRSERWP